MARVRNKQTGEVTEVADSQLGEAVASGGFDVSSDAMIPVVSQDGTVGTVPQSSLRAMIDNGGRLASAVEVDAARRQAEFGTLGQQARTVAEGAARGLTLGLSDVGAEALGADMEAMRARRDENPMAAAGSEVAGSIAPLIFSDGASTLVQGGGLAARGAAAARTGIRAAGVIPRAVAATGEAVTAGARAVLGEGALAKAAATGLGGAVEGAAVGLGQSLSGAALGDHELTAERLFADAGSGALFGLGAGAGLSLAASGVQRGVESAGAAMTRALRSETAQQLSNRFAFSAAARGGKKKRWVSDAEQFLGPNGAEAAGEIALRRGIVSEENRTARQIYAKAREEQAKAGAEINAVLRSADDAGARVNAGLVMQRIENEVIAPLQAIGGATSKRLAKKVRAEFSGFLEERAAAPGGMIGTRDLQQWRVKLEKQTKQIKREGQYGTADALGDARDIIEKEIDSAIVSQLPEMDGVYKKAKREYAGVTVITDAAKDTVKSDQANRLMSLTDYLGAGSAAVAFGASPAALAAAMVAGVAHKVLREQGSAVAAGLMRKAIQRVNGVEQAQVRAVSRALDIARGATRKATTVTPIVAAAGGGSVSEAFERRAARVAELSSQPAKMLELAQRVAGNSPSPTVQAAMGANISRAVGFLQSKMPTRLQSSDPLGRLRKRQKVSTHEALKFTRYANAVEDPKSVLKAIGNGTVTRAEMEALAVVYPKIHEQVVAGIINGLADLKEAPSLDSLTHLSIVIGQPLHPSLRPENIAAAQAQYAQSAENGGRGQPLVTPGNAQVSSKTARGSMTKSESIEAGG